MPRGLKVSSPRGPRTLPAVDPRLVTAGLSLLLGAAASFALQGLLGRRRRRLGLLV